MASRTTQRVQVGKRQIDLSNLAKVLFPDDEILKAELIEYYFKAGPTILGHCRGRPLSLVRYPDGITGASFFQKNRPEWAPEWIEHVTLGEERINYVLATDEASLAWMANLACIELHQMHCRAPQFDKPDYIVYDFDPPDTFAFRDVAELTLEFKEHLESFGYHPFVKTTGRKGLHIVTPIEPRWDFHQAFEAAKAVASPFVDAHLSAMTLHIKKEWRQGKVLLDIYRNRQSQTIVCAYSVRGLPGAPVSTPLHWDELSTLDTPKSLNLRTVPARILENGDPWEGMAAYATAIHTDRKKVAKGVKKLPSARTYKTPQQLESYSRKRSFGKTSEPPPSIASTSGGSAFVVHRHHATRLHYDLRLERDGVLKSWAVPKGLPPRPGILRLAVNVEDHPLDYVNFEGAIPKGQYGGGMMWKYAQGRYEKTKEKKNGFYFRLQSRELSGEFRIHHTKEKQWLLERVDVPPIDWVRTPIKPMLPQPAARLPESPDYVFEVKWDAIRVLVTLDEGEMRLHDSEGKEITAQFPDLLIPDKAFRATSCLFDGAIVCLDPKGKPDVGMMTRRMKARPGDKSDHPVHCYLFDCLYLDGRPIVNEPLTRRREWLQDAIRKDTAYRVSEVFDDGQLFLQAAREMGLGAIIAKRRDSRYLPGKQTDAWLKIPTRKAR